MSSGVAVLARTNVAPTRFPWPQELIEQLGRVSDIEIARRAGVGVQVVRDERRSRGIAPFVEPRPKMEWTQAALSLLGMASDKEVAAELGTNSSTVRNKRISLGIPPFRDPGVRRWTSWTADRVRLLGTASDETVARRLGLSRTAVRQKRRLLGIAPNVPPHRGYEWSEEVLGLLGKVHDIEVERRFGIKKILVWRKRKELGISPYDPSTLPLVRGEELRKMLELPTPELERLYGMSPKTVRKLRHELGVAAPARRARLVFGGHDWTPDELVLLGVLPDQEVAERVGVTREAAKQKRQKLGRAAVLLPNPGRRPDLG